jgi:hypothetical protein
MNKLHEYLNELETKISKQENYNNDISKSNVGWHIEHILLTINMIIEAVQKSNPKNYKWSFKLPRILVFSMNKIPRGRAKSPEVVVPKTYDERTLIEHLKITKIKIQELENLSSDKYFNHPFFGNLKLDKTIKFLEIHTNHHLEIINDIIKK